MHIDLISDCPLDEQLYTQGVQGRDRAHLKAFRVINADPQNGLSLINAGGKTRRITLQQIRNFESFMECRIDVKELRKDRNTSYLFGIHAAISDRVTQR